MMKPEEILEATKEAGFIPDWAIANCHPQFERFAKIIERKTIERCAAHFEAQPHVEDFGDNIAATIRKLGDEW